ncbi:putative methyltransferase [Helianthus anomalus]
MFVLFLLGFVFRVNTVNEYASFVLKEMLKDVVRTKTYLNIICKNIFFSKKRLFLTLVPGPEYYPSSIECSQMVDMAPEIVKGNGFSNGT